MIRNMVPIYRREPLHKAKNNVIMIQILKNEIVLNRCSYMSAHVQMYYLNWTIPDSQKAGQYEHEMPKSQPADQSMAS